MYIKNGMNKLGLKTTFKYRYKYQESFFFSFTKEYIFYCVTPRRIISSDYLRGGN